MIFNIKYIKNKIKMNIMSSTNKYVVTTQEQCELTKIKIQDPPELTKKKIFFLKIFLRCAQKINIWDITDNKVMRNKAIRLVIDRYTSLLKSSDKDVTKESIFNFLGIKEEEEDNETFYNWNFKHKIIAATFRDKVISTITIRYPDKELKCPTTDVFPKLIKKIEEYKSDKLYEDKEVLELTRFAKSNNWYSKYTTPHLINSLDKKFDFTKNNILIMNPQYYVAQFYRVLFNVEIPFEDCEKDKANILVECMIILDTEEVSKDFERKWIKCF